MADNAVTVTIIGAGIGGLAAALACSVRGFRVRIFEQAAELGEIGAGLHVSPNGVTVLRALGLEAPMLAAAAKPTAIATRHYATGIPNFEGPLDAGFVARFGAPFLSFHRADLHHILSEAVVADARIELTLGSRLTRVSTSADGAWLDFEDKPSLRAGLCVGADGVHSRVRTDTLGALDARFTGHVAYRGMTETEALRPGLIEPKLNVWVGPGKHVVAYPVRRGELINYVALVEESGWQDESWTTPADSGALKALFSGWAEPVRTLIELTAVGQCFKWALLVRDPMPTWSTPCSTLLGDAAHPMVPYLAQGAVMALEDAWTLAACLDAGSDLRSALSAYERARLERTAAVQAAAWRQGELNHAVGRDADGDNFAGGGFADPGWIYGHDVVADYPL